MNTQNKTFQTGTQIRLDSVHLPATAAAWKLPDLIGVSVFAGVVGLLSVGAIGFAWIVMKDAPAFNESVRKSQAYFQECYASATLQYPQAYSDDLKKICRAKSQLYKAQLQNGQS